MHSAGFFVTLNCLCIAITAFCCANTAAAKLFHTCLKSSNAAVPLTCLESAIPLTCPDPLLGKSCCFVMILPVKLDFHLLQPLHVMLYSQLQEHLHLSLHCFFPIFHAKMNPMSFSFVVYTFCSLPNANLKKNGD